MLLRVRTFIRVAIIGLTFHSALSWIYEWKFMGFIERVDITKQNSFSGWLWWNRFNRQWIFLLMLSCNAIWAMSIISRVLFCVIKHVLNNNASCSPVHFKLNFIIKQKGVSQGGNETALCMHVARLYYSHEQPDTCLHYNCSISSLLMLV